MLQQELAALLAVNLHSNRLADDGTQMLQQELVCLTGSQPPLQPTGRQMMGHLMLQQELTASLAVNLLHPNRLADDGTLMLQQDLAASLQSTSTPTGWQMMGH